MVTSRILARRRAEAGSEPAPRPVPRRRRSKRGGVISVGAPSIHAAALVARLRVSAFGRVYVVAAGVLAMAICYLFVAAQMTQTSYEMNRLRAQQAELKAEQDQLRYQGVQLHTPARVAQEAGVAGLAPAATPTKYLGYQPVAIDLGAATGQAAPDQSPLWQRAVAGLLTGMGANRDVQASDR